jgi:hypothetical protein
VAFVRRASSVIGARDDGQPELGSSRKQRTPAPSTGTARRSGLCTYPQNEGADAGSADRSDPYPGTPAIGEKRGKLARLPPSEPPDRAPRRQSKQPARQARWYVSWSSLSSKQFRGFSRQVAWAETLSDSRNDRAEGWKSNQ